ncbi:MAG TPA: hypothetical protein VHZ74_07120 [Bryobacteraceae bacterium]|nr:hypothetical protein [Bryobacteraceae bacterium]
MDELRRRQEERLLPAMDAWNAAKKNLEQAIALAETREKEYRELSDDVRRRLDAMQLVLGMAQELEQETSEQLVVRETEKPNGLLRLSSQKIFPAAWRAKYASLAIQPGELKSAG